jgi:hypothetical protein
VKKRWKLAIAAGVLLAIAASPIFYIETACTGAPAGWAANAPYKPLQPGAAGNRPEARTWLTFPEWYIVYSADSYGRYLAAGNRPSGYAYGRQIAGFWTGMCAANRAAGAKEAGDAKLMLYTIGLSYSVEMAVKGFYENVFGRIAEWIGGWDSANDKYVAQTWQRYGTFMHETPWYKFDFTTPLGGLWNRRDPNHPYRNWERRLGLSTEYAVKAAYAGLIGYASDAALDGAQPTLPFVARATPQAIAAVDARLHLTATLPGGLVAVEAPRYQQFNDLLIALSKTPIELVEIAGNDDVLVTLLVRDDAAAPAGTVALIDQPLDDRPGWRRLGLAVKVPALLALLRQAPASGAEIEHVYDY